MGQNPEQEVGRAVPGPATRPPARRPPPRSHRHPSRSSFPRCRPPAPTWNCSRLPVQFDCSRRSRTEDTGSGVPTSGRGRRAAGGRRLGARSPRTSKPSTPPPGPSRCADAHLPLHRPHPHRTPAPRPLTHLPRAGRRGSAEPRPPRGTRASSAPPPPRQPMGGAAARRRPIEGRGRCRGAVASSARPAPTPPAASARPPAPPGPRPRDRAWGLSRAAAGAGLRGAAGAEAPRVGPASGPRGHGHAGLVSLLAWPVPAVT